MIKIWYLNDNAEWVSTDNSTAIKIEEMLQRLQSWKGEKSFDAGDGVDYLSIFNKTAFLIPQLETIAEQYADFFQSVTFTDYTATPETIAINISIVLLSGNTVSRNILITV